MTTPESNLFTPHHLQGMELRNRLIRSATLEGLCGGDGQATPVLVDLYRQLAAGGCGFADQWYCLRFRRGKADSGRTGGCF